MSRVLTIALLAGACLPSAAQPADVLWAPEQIRAQWVGKKVFGRASNGQAVELQLAADGTATVSAGTLQDSGTWRLNESGYCATWKVIRAGQERCFTVADRSGTLYILNPDRSVGTEVIRVH